MQLILELIYEFVQLGIGIVMHVAACNDQLAAELSMSFNKLCRVCCSRRHSVH